MTDPAIIALLAPVPRLALAYAPAQSRAAWVGALALDARMALIVRKAREPLLGQLRLAWWRERLGEDPAGWPSGEPLLAALREGFASPACFLPLVDGWEALLDQAPLGAGAIMQAAEGRAQAFAALAPSDWQAKAQGMALGWALTDLAAHLTHPEERSAAVALVQAHDWQSARLPRTLRPLVVLHGLAARKRVGPGAWFTALRLGFLGL